MRDAFGGGGSSLPLGEAFTLVRSERDDGRRLEAYVRYAAGAVLHGLKPASLARMPRRRLDLERVWRAEGESLCGRLGLTGRVLREDSGGPLVLLYEPKLLSRALRGGPARRYLRARSYGEGSEACLDRLAERCAEAGNGRFPHEIGIFLGYPLADVVSFTQGTACPFPCRGYWRVYHNPLRAERIFARMDRARSLSTLRFFGSVGSESVVVERR